MDWRVKKSLLCLCVLTFTTSELFQGTVGGSTPAPPPPPQPKQQQPHPPTPQNQQQPPNAVEYKSEYVEPYQQVPKPPGPGPKYESGNTCKYDDPPWSDCDPFHLMRWRNKKLVSGIGCDLYKNETKQCGPDHFSPATKWLIAEHKKCVQELEHLKNMISDLHRWIDLIHERGQAMYHAFNELRKHLEDIQRQIRELHRQNHDNQILVERLRKELEEWKEKCRKEQVELEELKAKYMRLEKEHLKMKGVYQDMQVANEACKRDQRNLNKKIGAMLTENRELKGKLMDAERYKELVTKAGQRLAAHQDAIDKMKQEIHDTKEATQHCRIDLMNAKNRKPPTYNKDTHVNLDMQMWVTHNQTRDEYEQDLKKYDQNKPKDNGYREHKNRQHMMQYAQAKNYMANYGKQEVGGKHAMGSVPHPPLPPQHHMPPPPHPKQLHPLLPPHPPPKFPPPPPPKVQAKHFPSTTLKPTPTPPTPGPNRKIHPPPPPPPKLPISKQHLPPPPPPPPPAPHPQQRMKPGHPPPVKMVPLGKLPPHPMPG